LNERQDIHNSGIPKICRACEARHRGICGVLSPGELAQVAKHSRLVSLDAGSELIGDAEDIESYANVLKGVVKLSKMLSDGRQQLVGLQFAPDFLGRPFAKQSHLTAEAASDVELCRLPKAAMENLIDTNPALERKLLNQTLKELDEARDWMVTLGRKTAAEKVASFLYLIATHINPTLEQDGQNATTFDLPLTRSDIADFLGLTVETVSRQLTRLRTDKIVEISNNRHLTIPDISRLRLRCG
jgi:CRP/FNR family transcriptional regulator, anaerobic regulatory protein